jgi:hypothetical protein
LALKLPLPFQYLHAEIIFPPNIFTPAQRCFFGREISPKCEISFGIATSTKASFWKKFYCLTCPIAI